MRKQLPRPPVGLAHDTFPRYLLRSALDAQRYVNGFGIVFRGLCLAVMIGCAFFVESYPGLRLLMLAPLAVGLVLAASEWEQKPLDRLEVSAVRPIAFVAGHLVKTRERAATSVSGVLEAGIGPLLAGLLFAGPWAAPMPMPARLIALVALVLFLADALVQTTNDVGYFNLTEGKVPARWLIVVRFLLPAAVAVVAFALLQTTPVDLLSTAQAAAIAALLLFSYVPMALYDTTQRAALQAHASTLADATTRLRKSMASDHHLLESAIRSRASFPGTSPQTRLALQDIYFEVELLRARAATGREGHRTVEEVLTACSRVLGKRGQGGVVSIDSSQAEGVLLDVTSVQLIERLVLDLADNAITSATTTPKVDVAVSSPATDRATREVEVVVRDRGPGLKEGAVMKPGSSSEHLLIQCRDSDGDLEFSSTNSGTVARAWFRCENLNYFEQEEKS